jgi:archaellum component FlaC
MYDTLADLQQQKMDGMFASEDEYQKAVEEATLFYYERLEQYADLHGVAITTDGRVINEAWSADFANMVQDTAVWKDDVDKYLADANKAFSDWADGIGKVAEAVGFRLDEIGNNVGDVTDGFSKLKTEVNKVTNESTQLKNALVSKGGVIETVQSEITAVKNATEKYANLREELGRVKKSYEDLMVTINATIKA